MCLVNQIFSSSFSNSIIIHNLLYYRQLFSVFKLLMFQGIRLKKSYWIHKERLIVQLAKIVEITVIFMISWFDAVQEECMSTNTLMLALHFFLRQIYSLKLIFLKWISNPNFWKIYITVYTRWKAELNNQKY